MAKPSGTFRNIIIWSYERGTLQYDIICALILAFIFFVPKSCMTARSAEAPTHASSVQTQQEAPTEHQTSQNTKTEKHRE